MVTNPVGGESGLEVKHSILGERVGSVVDVHLELVVASSTHGDLVLPLLEVQEIKIVFEQQLLGTGSHS